MSCQITTFSLIGGHTAEEAVRRMLQSGLTNNLAGRFNCAGKGFKEAFKSTVLSDVLFGMFVKTQSHHTQIPINAFKTASRFFNMHNG